jgi:hypothetical protein
LVLIMSDIARDNLNSYLIRQASSCPLKLQYHQYYSAARNSGNNYKIETKIMMRRVLGIMYPGGREAGNNHNDALSQTEEWLKNDHVTIYGGVVAWNNYHARVPVLIKDGTDAKLLQLHGKVWKSNKRVADQQVARNKKLKTYIREAAYKKWLFGKVYPELDLSIRLCFPNSDFRSGTDNLFVKVAYGEASQEDVDSLFVEVDADEIIKKVFQSKVDLTLHPFFQDKTFEEQLNWMGNELRQPASTAPFQITDACNVCHYRSTYTNDHDTGCWGTHLNGLHNYPEKHVFDLIGHGNSIEAQRKNYFQEDVSLPPGVECFKDVSRYGKKTITIQQRRILQLLSSRGKRLPLKWLKGKMKKILRDLQYPLHFIDFEAATAAIPMQIFGKPYEPVYFQFSCHTLQKNGELSHQEWVDTDPRAYPHEQFVEKLTSVPGIMKGTIFQYSPFEKQALNTLYREFSRSSNKDERIAMKLQSLIKGSDNNSPARFIDMNRLVRDYYFNRYMIDGLGLKQVLMSTLKSSTYLQQKYEGELKVGNLELSLIEKTNNQLSDPYLINQNDNESVEDGSSAMHAWLHTKTPYCGKSRREQIQKALKVYCTLDSLALVIIFQEWMHLVHNSKTDGDIIEWE